jgi:hypothetical protein
MFVVWPLKFGGIPPNPEGFFVIGFLLNAAAWGIGWALFLRWFASPVSTFEGRRSYGFSASSPAMCVVRLSSSGTVAFASARPRPDLAGHPSPLPRRLVSALFAGP